MKDFKTTGASAHSKEEREENDFYATDPKALENFGNYIQVYIKKGGLSAF